MKNPIGIVTLLVLSIFVPWVRGVSGQDLNGYGATVPYVTYPVFDKKVCSLFSGAKFVQDDSTQCREAFGWAYAELGKTGAGISFIARDEANSILIRFGLPYFTPRNHDVSLSLYVNGKAAGKFSLSSWHLHMKRENTYSKFAYEPAEPDERTENIGRWWAETLLTNVAIHAGDRVSIQKDAGDEAESYFIDLVDLEMIPPPTPKPDSSWVSVVDEGATPDRNDDDDLAAIDKAMRKAASGNKKIWFPPGSYAIQLPIIVKAESSGLTFRGAGLWHTRIFMKTPIRENPLAKGVFLAEGSNVTISDLKIDRIDNQRRIWVNGEMRTAGFLVMRNGDGLRIEQVWFEHGDAPIWYAGRGGVFINNRVRSSYADGLHLQNEASLCVVSNNHMRGCGDDSIVHWASVKGTNGFGNFFLQNTADCPYMGRGIAAIGGKEDLYSKNLIRYGNILYGILLQSYRYLNKDQFCQPVENCIVRDNLVIGSGNKGALHFDSRDNSIQATVKNNYFIGSWNQNISREGGRPIEIEGEELNIFQEK